jgi:hypothetical protein
MEHSIACPHLQRTTLVYIHFLLFIQINTYLGLSIIACKTHFRVVLKINFAENFTLCLILCKHSLIVHLYYEGNDSQTCYVPFLLLEHFTSFPKKISSSIEKEHSRGRKPHTVFVFYEDQQICALIGT